MKQMKYKQSWEDAKKLIEYSKKGILSKELFKDERADATLFSMAAGTEMSEHTSSRDGFVCVLEGKGIFNLEGENIKMKAGTTIHMRKNMIHSLSAEENTSFVLLLF